MRPARAPLCQGPTLGRDSGASTDMMHMDGSWSMETVHPEPLTNGREARAGRTGRSGALRARAALCCIYSLAVRLYCALIICYHAFIYII